MSHTSPPSHVCVPYCPPLNHSCPGPVVYYSIESLGSLERICVSSEERGEREGCDSVKDTLDDSDEGVSGIDSNDVTEHGDKLSNPSHGEREVF